LGKTFFKGREDLEYHPRYFWDPLKRALKNYLSLSDYRDFWAFSEISKKTLDNNNSNMIIILLDEDRWDRKI
jgi:hypothetical protein